MVRCLSSCLAVACALATLVTLAGAPDAEAKPAAKPKAVEVKGVVPPGALDKLHSGDEAQIKSALDDVRLAGKSAAAAAPAIADLLDRGLSPELTVAAIETLADLESEAASPVLAAYAGHRVASIRQGAVKALARTRGPEAVKALVHALSDDDPTVRGLAASGLGSLKAKESVHELFVALDHKVSEASASIGQLCAPAECDQLMGKLGKLPFDVVTGGIDQALFRPKDEVDDDQKVKMIGRLRELGTAEANRFLRDVQKRWPANGSPRVRQAIDQGVLATSAGAQ